MSHAPEVEEEAVKSSFLLLQIVACYLLVMKLHILGVASLIPVKSEKLLTGFDSSKSYYI